MILTSVAIILRVLSNPLGNVFQKQLTNRYNHPLLINFLTFLLLSVFCIIPAIQVRWLELPFEFWKYCILAGIVGATGNGFLVKALQCGDLSVLGPINSYKSVVGIIVGIFLLGDIVGHSERRQYFAETDQTVNKRALGLGPHPAQGLSPHLHHEALRGGLSAAASPLRH